MTVNSLIASLGKHLSPANRAILSEVADDPVVQAIIAKAEQGALTDRHALKASLDAIPAKYAKQIKAAASECAAAYEAERRAEEVLAAARARRSAAVGSAYGLETRVRYEEDDLKTALRASAPNLLVAAERAVWRFEVHPHLPDFVVTFTSRLLSAYDEQGQADHAAAVAAADKANSKIHRQILAVDAELSTARAEFEAMKLEPLAESAIAERVIERFRSINECLVDFKGAPHFVIDEHMDISVKYGVDQKAFTIRPAEIGADKGAAK